MNKVQFNYPRFNINYGPLSKTLITKTHKLSYTDVGQILTDYNYDIELDELIMNGFVIIEENGISHKMLKYDDICITHCVIEANYNKEPGYYEVSEWYYKLITIRKQKLDNIISKIK